MKIELTKVISRDGYSERAVTVQQMTPTEFARFKKFAVDLGYSEKIIVDGKKVDKPLYRVLPEKHLIPKEKEVEKVEPVEKVETEPTAKEFRKNLFAEAKALDLRPAKNISTDKLIKLIEEAK